MSHEILTGPHPNLIILRIYGELMSGDLDVNAELGLGSGKPIYLLADASEMQLSVPENFLDLARRSAFSHPDVKHTAACLKPSPIVGLAKVVPKLTRQQEKVSVYNSYEGALAHLLALIEEAGL